VFSRAACDGRITVSSRLDWVAPDACTLPTAEQPLRVAEFDALFAETLVRAERVSPTHARLELSGPADTAARARNLTEREIACCSFFDFTVTEQGIAVGIDVRVPDARADVLAGLVTRAESQMQERQRRTHD
jgi:hypothetical protein